MKREQSTNKKSERKEHITGKRTWEKNPMFCLDFLI